MKDYLPHLQNAIRAMHGSDSIHLETVPVKIEFQKLTAWEGEVEVFELIDHPTAKRCFAWAYMDGQEFKATAVLQHGPIDSAEKAVSASIVALKK